MGSPEADRILRSRPSRISAHLTLVGAGFEVGGAYDQGSIIEFECQRSNALGASIPFLIAINQASCFRDADIEAISESARADSRIPVLVASEPGDSWLGWVEFTDALGGEIPSWEALSSSFADALVNAGSGTLPDGMTGEPWALFEELCRSGISYLFGRRAIRLGGRKLFLPVSDIQAMAPNMDVYLIDAKSSKDSFSVTREEVRKWQEYVEKQKIRQQGQAPLRAIVVIANQFEQGDAALLTRGTQFVADTQVRLVFVETSLVVHAIAAITENGRIRNALSWRDIFRLGLASFEDFDGELSRAVNERVDLDI